MGATGFDGIDEMARRTPWLLSNHVKKRETVLDADNNGYAMAA